MDTSPELSHFAFSLDSSPRGLTTTRPTSPWSYSLTPSIYGRGLTPVEGGFNETNPFETSFFSSHDKAKPAGDYFDLDQTPGGLAGTPFGGPKRKRALSSPAVTPGGFGLDISVDSQEPPKRIRRNPSSSFSPESSTLLTPPDTSIDVGTPSQKELDESFLSLDGGSIDPSYHAILAATTHAELAPISTRASVPFATSQPPSVAPAQVSTTYDQYYVPPSDYAVPPAATAFSMAQLERERQTFAASRAAYVQTQPAPVSLPASMAPLSASAPPASSMPVPSSKELDTSGGKKGKNQPPKSKKGKKNIKEEEIDNEDDEEDRRKLFLERNRVAACKSRQKKKERVNLLETQSNDYAARNVALQSVAVSLRSEVLALRQLLSLHDGCNCEHVKGYLKREAAGGGIPTIDALAGRVMELDYTNVPSMGSEDDLYAHILRHDREDSVASASTEGRLPTRNARRQSVEVKAAPASASKLTMSTRRTSRANETAQVANAAVAAASSVAPMPFLGAIPVKRRQMGPVAPTGYYPPTELYFQQQQQQSHVMNRGERSSSAPPTTPSWDYKVRGAGEADSYFPIQI